jgi:hypothetical protein
VAALAAGGWGIDGSRCVHSVGRRRVLAGGAEEVAARPEWLLWAASLSSVVDVPVELRGGSAAPCMLATRRSCGACLPLAGGRVTAAPVVEDLDGGGDIDQAGVVRGAGWRLSGAEDGRLPVRGGAPPSPSFEWRSGGGVFPNGPCWSAKTKLGSRRSNLYFRLCSGFFCKKIGLILPVPFAQKMLQTMQT